MPDAHQEMRRHWLWLDVLLPLGRAEIEELLPVQLERVTLEHVCRVFGHAGNEVAIRFVACKRPVFVGLPSLLPGTKQGGFEDDVLLQVKGIDRRNDAAANQR